MMTYRSYRSRRPRMRVILLISPGGNGETAYEVLDRPKNPGQHGQDLVMCRAMETSSQPLIPVRHTLCPALS